MLEEKGQEEERRLTTVLGDVEMSIVLAWVLSKSACAPVVHGNRAAAERLRRDQLEPSRAGQPALVQGRAVAGDPGMDEQLVLIDKIQSVQLGRELAATEENALRGRIL